MVRDDAQEDVRTAEDVWLSDVLRLDVGKHRERRLRQVLERLQGQPESAEAAEAPTPAEWPPVSDRGARRSNDAGKSVDRVAAMQAGTSLCRSGISSMPELRELVPAYSSRN